MRILQLTDMQVIDVSQRRRPDRLSANEIERWAPENAEMNCYSPSTEIIIISTEDIMSLSKNDDTQDDWFDDVKNSWFD